MILRQRLIEAAIKNDESPITWWLMLLLCTLMAAIFLGQIPERMQIRQVMRQRELVSVEIMRPTVFAVGSRKFQYLDFRYDGIKRSVRISHNFYERVRLKPNTELYHLPEYPDLFLPPDYDVKWESISDVALCCFFVLMIPFCIARIYKLRKTP